MSDMIPVGKWFKYDGPSFSRHGAPIMVAPELYFCRCSSEITKKVTQTCEGYTESHEISAMEPIIREKITFTGDFVVEADDGSALVLDAEFFMKHFVESALPETERWEEI